MTDDGPSPDDISAIFRKLYALPANKTQFFKQHGSNTDDVQQKYKSRAATLYRSRVSELAVQAQRLNGTKLFIDRADHVAPLEKDDHEDFLNKNFPYQVAMLPQLPCPTPETAPLCQLGAKKAGFGAQKIKLNFTDAEQKANEFDKERETFAKLTLREDTVAEVKGSGPAESASLASKFMVKECNDKKAQEKIKEASKDPTKSKIVDRLGISGGMGRGVSHSITSGIRTIQQENVSKGHSKKSNIDSFNVDDWEVIKDERSSLKKSSFDDNFFSTPATKEEEINDEFFDAWDKPSSKNEKQGEEMDYETRSNLSKFEGQKSIGSADLFGGGSGGGTTQGSNSGSYYSSYTEHVPEMADIKDSVKHGVSKVAGKISDLGSSVSSYLSDRY